MMPVSICKNMTVTLVGHYGDELAIAKQAWMSTGKEADRSRVPELIRTLVRRRHDKPLEVVSFHFDVSLPIAIDRQLVTYRSLTSSIANSGRYGSVPLEQFVPAEVATMPAFAQEAYLAAIRASYESYQSMVAGLTNAGTSSLRAREIARFLLPQGQMTSRQFTINLRSLLHFLDERLDKHAQAEIRWLAREMLAAVRPLVPTVFDAFEEFGRLKVPNGEV